MFLLDDPFPATDDLLAATDNRYTIVQVSKSGWVVVHSTVLVDMGLLSHFQGRQVYGPTDKGSCVEWVLDMLRLRHYPVPERCERCGGRMEAFSVRTRFVDGAWTHLCKAPQRSRRRAESLF